MSGGDAAAAAAVVTVEPMSAAERDVVLTAHNRARAEVGVPPLEWDDALERAAMEYAAVCDQPFQHWSTSMLPRPCFAYDPANPAAPVGAEAARIRGAQAATSQCMPMGENLYHGQCAQPLESAMRLWYDEIACTVCGAYIGERTPDGSASAACVPQARGAQWCGKEKCAMCGHYTQMVWQSTRRIGCAKTKCPSGTDYVVCEYFPSGNVQNLLPFDCSVCDGLKDKFHAVVPCRPDIAVGEEITAGGGGGGGGETLWRAPAPANGGNNLFGGAGGSLGSRLMPPSRGPPAPQATGAGASGGVPPAPLPRMEAVPARTPAPAPAPAPAPPTTTVARDQTAEQATSDTTDATVQRRRRRVEAVERTLQGARAEEAAATTALQAVAEREQRALAVPQSADVTAIQQALRAVQAERTSAERRLQSARERREQSEQQLRAAQADEAAAAGAAAAATTAAGATTTTTTTTTTSTTTSRDAAVPPSTTMVQRDDTSAGFGRTTTTIALGVAGAVAVLLVVGAVIAAVVFTQRRRRTTLTYATGVAPSAQQSEYGGTGDYGGNDEV